MPAIVVVGTQWGDEGKGKIVHLLGRGADMIVRYQGGPNAGHTVVFDGKMFVLHLIPAGILIPKKTCVIANGVVVDPVSLYEEVHLLEKQKIRVRGRLKISELAHLILPYHKMVDIAREEERDSRTKIGTTRKGIGPAYADKVERTGIRLIDYLEPETFDELLEQNLRLKSVILSRQTNLKKLRREILEQAKRLRPFLAKFVCDTSKLLNQALAENKKVIFESAQGTMLDLDFGTYPYVTSSNPISGSVGANCGIAPDAIGTVLGIVKAYATRVGEGPFPTELEDATGEQLREVGKEFGATTGRPRRCGWFDAVVVRRALLINGIKKMALTKLDVLAGIHPLWVCVAYQYQGRRLENFPNSRMVLKKCKPVYQRVEGFSLTPPLSPGGRGEGEGVTIKNFSQLPKAAQRYVKFLEKVTGGKFSFISLGRSRDETIRMERGSLW